VTAVLALARHELRRRWRSALALTMLVGVVGAIVLATAAGAHRSSSALRRFVAYSRSSDVEIHLDDPTPAQLEKFRRVPEVADFALLRVYALTPHGRPSLKNAATVDGRLGTVIDRARLIAGRVANPDAANETMIGEGLAAQMHLGVGDHLEADSITPGQIAMTYHDQNPGPAAGPLVRLQIVGIYRRPLDLGDLAASGGVVIETPAFDRAYRGRVGLFTTVLRVRTRHGIADVPRVTTEARQVFDGTFSAAQDVSAEARGGEDAINVLTLALWIFAGVAALAGGVATAIVISRDVMSSELDRPTLTALGLTPRECIAVLGLRVLPVAIAGLVLATVGAVALSPMFPIGIARRAEPTPGVRVDWLVLGVGLVIVAVFVAVIGFVAARRVAGRSFAAGERRKYRRRPTLAEVAARSGLRPPVVNGLRMALEPGRGKRALPVRSAFFGAAFGVIGLTAALVFSSSLGHLDASPRLYGWTWDFKAPDDTFSTSCGANDYRLAEVPGVAAVAAVCYETGLPIDGRPTSGWGFTPIRGSIQPEIVSGRAPSGRTDVALGAATMRALGKRIGDTVTVRGANETSGYRIVGQVVLPQLQDGEIQPLADGAAFTGEGFAPLVGPHSHVRYLVGQFAPGVDRAAVGRRIDAIPQFRPLPQQAAFAPEQGASGPTRPPELDRLRNIDWFPPLLAALIAVLALVAVGHVLVTTAHRRRSELAVLKTLGFERRQIRASFAWQATTVATIGLVVGVPVGAVVGRLVWRGVAGSLGIAPAVVVPMIAVAFTVAGVMGLMNAVAFVPAFAAARTSPADALREE
jgi:hypothetical protein